MTAILPLKSLRRRLGGLDISGFRDHFTESWSASWPMLLAICFEFLISLTDVYVAGRLGKQYQASVGIIAQVYFLFIVLAVAMTVGGVSVLSKLHTAGDRAVFNRSAYSILVSVALTGVLLGLAGYILAPLAVGLLSIPAVLKPICLDLLPVYAAGIPVHYLLINTNGMLRASKRARKSMYTMALVCLLNVGLNLTFLFFTDLGVRGIPLATVSSLTAGAVLNLFFIRDFLAGPRIFERSDVLRMASVGWPMGLLQLFWQLGSTVLFLILGSLPENSVEIIAAFTNGLRIEAAIFLPAMALGMSNAAVVGNYLGEKKGEDAFRAGLVTGVTGVLLVIACIAAVVANARPLAGLLSDSPMVVQESVRYLYTSALADPFMAWAVILGGGLNGAGDTKAVFVIVALSQWLVRIPLAYLLAVSAGLGPLAVWWAMNASLVVWAGFITRRYLGKRWIRHA